MSPIAGGLHSPGSFYPSGQQSPNSAVRPMTPGRREHSPLTVIHEEERTEERLLKDLKFDLMLGLVLSGLTKMHSKSSCGNGLIMALSYSSETRSSGSSSTSGDATGSAGTDLGPMSNTMRNSFMERYVEEIIGNRSDSVLLFEKVSLYYRCMQHVATALHKARNLISSGEIKKSDRFRQVCMDLATLYTKIGDSLADAKQESLKVQSLMPSHDDFRSNCSLALEEDDDEQISESDSSEEEQIRSADKLIFIYALSLSMHAAGVEITVGTNASPVNFGKKRCEEDDGKVVEVGNVNKSHTQNLLNCYNKAYTLFKSLEKETPEDDVQRKQQLSDYLKAIQIRINALCGRASPVGARRYRRTSTRTPRSRQGSTSSLENYLQGK